MSAHMKARRTDLLEIPLKFRGKKLINMSELRKLSPEMKENVINAINRFVKATDDSRSVPAREVFADLEEKYGKAGTMLRGLRVREGLTQKEFAKKLGLEQSTVSAMESGKRPIGKKMAQRLAKVFKTDYRLFL